MLNERMLERLRGQAADVVIRGITLGDARAVLAMYLASVTSETGEEPTQEAIRIAAAGVGAFLSSPDSAGFICEVDGEPVGQLLFSREPELSGEGHYLRRWSHYVKLDYRSGGVAQRLLVALADYAKQTGATRCVFLHDADGCPKFYERLGAVPAKVEYEVRFR